MRWAIARLFVVLLSIGVVPVANCVPAEAAEPSTDDQLRDAWDVAKLRLAKDLYEAGGTGAAYASIPAALYYTQIRTANLLIYAGAHGDWPILEDLAEIFQIAFDRIGSARTTAIYQYAVTRDGRNPRYSRWPLATPVPFWTQAAEGFPEGVEEILSSAQFLYAVTRLMRVAAEAQAAGHPLPAAVVRLLNEQSTVVSHYKRWVVHRNPGAFGRQQWFCNKGTFNHHAHVVNLLRRRYGSQALPAPTPTGPGATPSFCNAVVDMDLWIIGGVVELLMAKHAAPGLIRVDDAVSKKLEAYAKDAVALIVQRSTATHIPVNGSLITGAVFDPGAFDDYGDYKYAGYLAGAFPGWINSQFEAANCKGPAPTSKPLSPAVGVGWDLSHARRLVSVLDTLEHAGRISSGLIAQYAAQFRYKVWNGDFIAPKFRTYFDGSNGWFRVNYRCKSGRGTRPFGQTPEVSIAGYALWARFEPELGTVLNTAFAQSVATIADPVEAALWRAEGLAQSLFYGQ